MVNRVEKNPSEQVKWNYTERTQNNTRSMAEIVGDFQRYEGWEIIKRTHSTTNVINISIHEWKCFPLSLHKKNTMEVFCCNLIVQSAVEKANALIFPYSASIYTNIPTFLSFHPHWSTHLLFVWSPLSVLDKLCFFWEVPFKHMPPAYRNASTKINL